MANFTSEQIVQIWKIFNRIVDCNGNLMVFKDFDWELTKSGKKFSNDNFPIVYTREYEDNNGDVKYKDTFDENEVNQKQSNEKTLKEIHKNGLNTFYNEPSTMFGIYKANIGTLGITADIINIGQEVKDKRIGEYFSVLLHKFPNDIKKDDLVTLYTAFYDILKICNYDFSIKDNQTILLVNIFQKLIEYFKDGKNEFFVWIINGNAHNISKKLYDLYSNIFDALELCFKLRKILCLLLHKIDWSGSGVPLSDEELKEILGDDLWGVFNAFRELISKAIVIIITTIKLTKGAKNIIYYGAPGTGKTKFVEDCLKILDKDRDRTEWVQFHSGFEYEDFIDGIKPNGIQNGSLNLTLMNGVFKDFCEKAEQDISEDFFFVVDEINRADISAVFGETLSLLEKDYRDKSIKTKNYALSKQEFSIPANIYFIGIMNDVDKSIDCFDLALRRRFTWVLMRCDYGIVEAQTDAAYKEKCEKLNKYITSLENDGLNLGRAYEIGHSYFLKKEIMSEQEIWDRHIEPILREYIRTQFSDTLVEEKLKVAEDIFVNGK